MAESAIAYMGALNKHFKFYQREIDERHKWDYAAAPQWPRLEDQVLGIVGFGKIGKCTAEKAMGLVKRVIACDPHADDAAFAERGVTRVSKEELLAHADIIVNHMCLTDDNVRFFDEAAFDAMERRPIFINLGRGLCVDEEALWTRSMRASSVRSARTCCTTGRPTWPRTSWWGATTSSSRPILRFTRPRLSKTWSV
ncbi:MAG: NAD(P)-dependent oxidoreductase [Eggerthellaceae bacterium]